ncbi:NPCBM/NEW2 domain-containing protein [Deinococcus sonorensis]|uniref:NPCBM/NEW2 domain-containing protein n=2 Tax=Deinococcus sonorensis TaxID=309891 RepID=A0AAU7UGP0_9DEIO
MKKLAATLALSLLLAACGQQATSPAADDWAAQYAAHPSDPWMSTRLSALSLTPGVNTLYYETPTSATNGWGPIEVNRSNGGRAANDGHPLTVGGKVYAKGYGVHANSELRYDLTGTGAICTKFTVTVGVDDEVGNNGSVLFILETDNGDRLADSGILHGYDGAKTLSVSLIGRKTLTLRAFYAGDNTYYDHADWLNPQITCISSGTPDLSFSGDGRVELSGLDHFHQVLPVAGGKILALTSDREQGYLHQYLANGQPDLSFGKQGTTVLASGELAPRQMALTRDGKVVVHGLLKVDSQTYTNFLARYFLDGRVDTSFGTGGRVLQQPVTAGQIQLTDEFAPVVQANGKVIMPQHEYTGTTYPDLQQYLTLVRYQANGALDPSFGQGGHLIYPGDPDDAVHTPVFQQRDGGLLVEHHPTPTAATRLDRLTADGQPDLTFGTAGGVEVQVVPNQEASSADAIAEQPDGRLLVSGVARDVDGNVSCYMARYTARGQLDASFGSGGVTLLKVCGDPPTEAFRMHVQKDGRIVAAFSDHLIRVQANGQLDPTFGSGGTVQIDPYLSDLALQEDGKLLVTDDIVTRLPEAGYLYRLLP